MKKKKKMQQKSKAYNSVRYPPKLSNIFTISYQHLKSPKYLVSVGFSCPGFYFLEHFDKQFACAYSLYSKYHNMTI